MNINDNFGYTATEQWEYRPIILYFENQERTWVDIGQSYYWASRNIVEGVVNGTLREDIEGRAALFLFRHYIEVTLKEIIMASRGLTSNGGLSNESVKPIKTGHNLLALWESVLKEARPKMPKDAPWVIYDCEFAEKCIKEFDAADLSGFAFRYAHQGGERAQISFRQLLASMDHVFQVLDAVLTVLIETWGDLVDWQDELKGIAGW